MSGPWMKWYPSDWRADPKLRMCSLAARGLWADMLALMHEAEPYGHLLVGNCAPSDKQLASLVGATAKEVSTALTELETAGVFSRAHGDIIYSRRMVRDKEKAERDRENGKGGGNPKLVKPDKRGVNPPIKPRSQKPEARSQKRMLTHPTRASSTHGGRFIRTRSVSARRARRSRRHGKRLPCRSWSPESSDTGKSSRPTGSGATPQRG